MILHKLSSSPFESTEIAQCLQRVAEQDKILLMENAVYGLNHNQISAQLKAHGRVFVLIDDAQARGVNLPADTFVAVSYSDFVTLCAECTQVISW